MIREQPGSGAAPETVPGSAVPVMDPGLQAERTSISWQRTALSLGGLAALLLHAAQARAAARLPGIIGLVIALLLLLISERRYLDSLRQVRAGGSPSAPGAIRLVAAGVVLLAVAAMLLVISEP